MILIRNEFDFLNEYGISSNDLYKCQQSFEKTLNYLKFHKVRNGLNKSKSLLEITFSSNFCQNYHNELLNRIEVLNAFNIEKHYTSIFITATLDSQYRDFLFADYSNLKASDLVSIPKHIKEKINQKLALTIVDLKDILNQKLKIFNNFYNRKYKAYKIKYCKVFEPHKKLGVPHLHMILFIPNNAEIIEDFKNAYMRLFPAPQNLRTDKLTLKQKQNGELNGFQTSINNSIAYIMKYLQKTFLNLKHNDINNIKIDKLTAWYIKHKIRRFTMSRFLVPLWLYRKLNFIPSLRDYFHLNNELEKHNNILEKDYKNNKFFIHIETTNQTIIYENKHLIYESNNRIINEYKSNFEFFKVA
ncbi:putative phage replication initiation protein [Campylobacter sp. RM5004]|uniref:rolling circle replication-associated protein n=1 Tax=Campylobacter sp. RM5004 TaxID=1660078 RepID=UPI001EFB7290|nr:replication endonuclease [Campylobacter sp. RM5004]ULO01289.1 putative phage replication initiation protein [Campylobacter sp. RM5004]